MTVERYSLGQYAVLSTLRGRLVKTCKKRGIRHGFVRGGLSRELSQLRIMYIMLNSLYEYAIIRNVNALAALLPVALGLSPTVMPKPSGSRNLLLRNGGQVSQLSRVIVKHAQTRSEFGEHQRHFAVKLTGAIKAPQ